MTFSLRSSRSRRAGAAAALLLAGAGAACAGTPITGTRAAAAAEPGCTGTQVAAVAPLTRAAVRDSLLRARAMNTMSRDGDITDTTDVLQARETFAALQTEVYQTQAQQAMKAQEAQLAQALADRDNAPMNLLRLAAAQCAPAHLLVFVDEE